MDKNNNNIWINIPSQLIKHAQSMKEYIEQDTYLNDDD